MECVLTHTAVSTVRLEKGEKMNNKVTGTKSKRKWVLNQALQAKYKELCKVVLGVSIYVP